MIRFAPFALTTGAVLCAASARLPGQTNNCIPPTSHSSPVTSLDQLRGSTLLIVYATAGPRKGRITSGTVDMEVASAELKRRGIVMVGSSTLDLRRVGAQYVGSLRSRDPGAPGVTLEAQAAGRSASLTFGSIRTAGTNGVIAVPVTRFDLSEKSHKGFRGLWHTIGGVGAQGSGYFCASRF